MKRPSTRLLPHGIRLTPSAQADLLAFKGSRPTLRSLTAQHRPKPLLRCKAHRS